MEITNQNLEEMLPIVIRVIIPVVNHIPLLASLWRLSHLGTVPAIKFAIVYSRDGEVTSWERKEGNSCGVHGIYLKFRSFNGIDPIVPTEKHGTLITMYRSKEFPQEYLKAKKKSRLSKATRKEPKDKKTLQDSCEVQA
jgi:hypothetical protein